MKVATSKAVYTNLVLNETYTLAGVVDLAKAWELVSYAATRNGWNVLDVTVKFIS